MRDWVVTDMHPASNKVDIAHNSARQRPPNVICCM
jgi:hypothetical protein